MRTFEFILLIVVTILPFVKRKLASHIRPGYIVLFLGLLPAVSFNEQVQGRQEPEEKDDVAGPDV